jgi:hypothetical protein
MSADSNGLHYFDLAEQAARRGEVSFLRYCFDEILRASEAARRRPNYARLFEILHEARLYLFQSGPTDADGVPTDVLSRLRELDGLTTAINAAAEGQAIGDVIQRIRSLTLHPISPKRGK